VSLLLSALLTVVGCAAPPAETAVVDAPAATPVALLRTPRSDPPLIGPSPYPGGVIEAVREVPPTLAASLVAPATASRAAAAAGASAGVPVGPCMPLYGPRTTVPVRVTATSRSMVVSWRHNGDPAAVAYYVGVQPRVWVRSSVPGTHTLAPITWTPVMPTAGCSTMTFPVPGVRSGVEYAVWLEADLTTPEFAPGVSRTGLGRATVRMP
jgi:hypothetical protein